MNHSSYVTDQYKTSANFDARYLLHERFSTNAYPWMRWVFDQLVVPARGHILEIGCGTGKLWQENLDRLPAEWSLTLADQSAGMLAQAGQNLGESTHALHFEQCDVQQLPFVDERFDVVIANHMLYHVADLPLGLSEIRRVLKRGGRLFAATNGQQHMSELHQLLHDFDQQLPLHKVRLSFTLENGADWLMPYFDRIEQRLFDSNLAITEVEPLVAYVSSAIELTPAQHSALAQHVAQTLRAHNGVFTIHKATGLFVAQKL